ncbi:hypothetical protein A2Z41_02295 [Microgenomates group bacterium RBG_19FT_COMBO_39_10]|nr:MAG: hypothetical protein A2Z41_02295 [Microgenomates group bacterium RBG_19FT_COMBO_39_10]
MKKVIRSFVINLAAIIIISQSVEGFIVSGGYQGLLFTAAVLTGINLAIKPLIKLLLLPINLITLGAFRWVANVFSLYLVTLLVPYLEIIGFAFPGYAYQGFIIPEMYLAKIWVIAISSFFISLITTFLFWLF